MGVNLSCCYTDSSTSTGEEPQVELLDLKEEFDLEGDDQEITKEPEKIGMAKRKAKRGMTYKMVNNFKDDDEEDMSCRKSMDIVRKASSRASVASTRASQRRSAVDGSEKEAAKAAELETNMAKDEMLAEVELLVDKAYDILPAEMILKEIEDMIGTERFLREVMTLDLFERFGRKLDFFYNVGSSCAAKNDAWLEVYNMGGGKQTIHGQIDPEDSRTLMYRVCAEIPTSLKNVMAVAHELELFTSWNQLIVGDPKVFGRRTAHYVVLNYQISALGGVYKADVLNEIRRFSDAKSGFLVEYITSVSKDHPCFVEPAKGFKRMQTILKNIVLACGPNHTVLIQAGKLRLPFSIAQWQAKIIGQVAGKFIVGGLVNNSMRAETAESPWEKPIAEDKYGLYERLAECTECEASQKRAPRDPEKGLTEQEMANLNADLEQFFSSRRFHRESQRQRYVRQTVGESTEQDE